MSGNGHQPKPGDTVWWIDTPWQTDETQVMEGWFVLKKGGYCYIRTEESVGDEVQDTWGWVRTEEVFTDALDAWNAFEAMASDGSCKVDLPAGFLR